MPICNNKIDIHAHAVVTSCPNLDFVGYPTPENLLEAYAKYGISQGVLLPLASPEGRNVIIPTETVEAIASKYPDQFFWAIGLDPRMLRNNPASDFGALLEYYKSQGAKSVGEMIANLNFDDPLYDNMLAQCAEHDLPVTIHMSPAIGLDYGVVDDPGLPRLEKMLKKYPKLKIFGHSVFFWEHMTVSKDKPGRIHELMVKYDNLYCDISAGSGFRAMTTNEEIGLDFLETFRDRVMFGCDFGPNAVGSLAMWLDRMYLDGRLAEDVYQKVCRENAIRILKL